MTDDIETIEALFHAAADLPIEQRQPYLDRVCEGRPTVRARVDAMLVHLDRGESLGQPVADRPGDESEEQPGAIIGRYKLLQTIGEGGFGVVYMAEQQEPVVRKVALKVIKLGMDTKEIIARFEAERQALALMDHPNIAKVLDGGSTERGRPFFVMELVRGVSITEYCDAQTLAPRDRLELFAKVCDAVQHAHQKGVVHRDLKPTNVMVTMHDGRPVPKVIDFGIAKAMHTRLTERTLFTEYHRFLGTPAYMSPEQSEMSALDVDTRSDVYSLGVLLYELLTGATPFDPEELVHQGLAEIQRVIREVEPPRPSLRISTSADKQIASHRHLEATSQLSKLVRGDLDWIVMRALEKDRTRRYGTASGLAADIRRHLADEPVDAGPPRATYRLRKYLVRNRTFVTAAALLVLALVAGIVGTTLGLVEASAQRNAAEVEARRTGTMLDFLSDMIVLTDPAVTLDPDLSVRELLDVTADRIDDSLRSDPVAAAHVRSLVGRAYASMGQFELAERHLRRGIREAEPLVESDGYERFELYTSLWALTEVVFRLDRHDAFGVALAARATGQDILRTTHPKLAADLDALLTATQEVDRSRVPELFRAAATRADRELPQADLRWEILADAMMAGGYSMWFSPEEAHSIPLLEKAIQIYGRTLPPHHPAISDAQLQLASVFARLGRDDEAVARTRQVIVGMRKVHDPDHWRIGYAQSLLGECLCNQGHLDQAEQLLLTGHEALMRRWTALNFFGTESLCRLVRLYDLRDQPNKARPFRDQLVGTFASTRYVYQWFVGRIALGATPLRDALDAMHKLVGPKATVEIVEGNITDLSLDELAHAAVATRRAGYADDHPVSMLAARDFLRIACAFSPGQLADAERTLLEDACRVFATRPDTSVPLDHAESHAKLARLDHAAGDTTAARAHALRAVELVAQTEGDASDWVHATSKVRTGRVLLELGMHEAARRLVEPSHHLILRQVGPTHVDTARSRAVLHDILIQLGDHERAREFEPLPLPPPTIEGTPR